VALHAHITREIERSPRGPRIGAFFDVDGTLIAGFSAVAFVRDRLFGGQMSPRDVAGALFSITRFQAGRLGFSGLIAATAAWLRGVPERELEELAERIFTNAIATSIYPESRTLVQAHRKRGHTSRSSRRRRATRSSRSRASSASRTSCARASRSKRASSPAGTCGPPATAAARRSRHARCRASTTSS
jgi:hypothetical protein